MGIAGFLWGVVDFSIGFYVFNFDVFTANFFVMEGGGRDWVVWVGFSGWETALRRETGS